MKRKGEILGIGMDVIIGTSGNEILQGRVYSGRLKMSQDCWRYIKTS